MRSSIPDVGLFRCSMQNGFLMIFVWILSLLIYDESIAQDNSQHNRAKNTFVTFAEVKDYYDNLKGSYHEDQDLSLYAGIYGYAMIVNSTGKSRELSQERLNYLKLLFKSMNMAQDPATYFSMEVLVETDVGNYWFPIQKNLFTSWKQEMSKGKSAMLFIRAYGSVKAAQEDRWLFTINSFISNAYDGLWEIALESFNSGDEQNGLRCLERLIELDPSDGRNYSMYGYYFYDQGYPDKQPLLIKADSLYTKAIKLSPDFSYVYYQKALVKFQLGEYQQCWQAIEKARGLGERNIEDFFLKKLEEKLPYLTYLKTKE